MLKSHQITITTVALGTIPLVTSHEGGQKDRVGICGLPAWTICA